MFLAIHVHTHIYSQKKSILSEDFPNVTKFLWFDQYVPG